MAFTFHNPGRLVDGELELIAPAAEWVADVLSACAHPLTVRDAPEEAGTTQGKLAAFLAAAPNGLQPPDPPRGWLPTYHFWMRLSDGVAGTPPVRIAGGMSLRIGLTPEIELYSGNIGYHVFPPARGRRYAERACRLVLPLARGHGLGHLWITCNPDNTASRRTCERLGARLVEIVAIPPDHPFRTRGETHKCRYLVPTS